MSRTRLTKEWTRMIRGEDLDIHNHFIQGLGKCRIQLFFKPAFQQSYTWHIFEANRVFHTYKSYFILGTRTKRFELIDVKHRNIISFLKQLRSLSFPLAPVLSRMIGTDGDRTAISMYGDLHSAFRFEWWSDWPENWAPLVALTEKMIKVLSKAPVVADTPKSIVSKLIQADPSLLG